jgi:ubiquinone/menaquinone biosynthesis C-methylase UbiE
MKQGKPSRKPNRRDSIRTDWSPVADWYDELVGESGSEYHREVVIPGVLRLLAAKEGEAVIDVACGQGVLCRALQSRGVGVTGADAAVELIRAARERGPAEIHYEVADALNLSNFADAKFDAAACVLAIQNIHPLPPVFRSIARILKSSGRLVLVMMHPCFRGPKETSWGWDEAAKVQYRRVDRYLIPRKTPIVTHPGSKPDQYTWEFHRPIGGYVKALTQSGFAIDAMEEWPSHKRSTSGPRAGAENVAREEIPMFLAIRAVKNGQRHEGT